MSFFMILLACAVTAIIAVIITATIITKKFTDEIKHKNQIISALNDSLNQALDSSLEGEIKNVNQSKQFSKLLMTLWKIGSQMQDNPQKDLTAILAELSKSVEDSSDLLILDESSTLDEVLEVEQEFADPSSPDVHLISEEVLDKQKN